jgi:hypothetical protein
MGECNRSLDLLPQVSSTLPILDPPAQPCLDMEPGITVTGIHIPKWSLDVALTRVGEMDTSFMSESGECTSITSTTENRDDMTTCTQRIGTDLEPASCRPGIYGGVHKYTLLHQRGI